MFNFDRIDLQRFTVSAMGAVTLSLVSMVAAAGPVRAAAIVAPLTVNDWQNVMAQRIASFREHGSVAQPSRLLSSDIAVHFTREGAYSEAAIARSSGDHAVDERALTIARTLHYAALPAAMRGAPATVRLTLYFGSGADSAAAYDLLKDHRHQPARLTGDAGGIETAAR